METDYSRYGIVAMHEKARPRNKRQNDIENWTGKVSEC